MERLYAIDIDVATRYLDDQSEPEQDRYVFAYTIRIHNSGKLPARLLTRQERFQLFGDDAVQNGFFRLAGNIFERSVRHGAVKARRSANSSRRRISDFPDPFIRRLWHKPQETN